jgi:hypothetical protein
MTVEPVVYRTRLGFPMMNVNNDAVRSYALFATDTYGV